MIRSQLSRLPYVKNAAERLEQQNDLRLKAWASGILTVSIYDDRLPWPDREFLKQIGSKIYGFSPHKE